MRRLTVAVAVSLFVGGCGDAATTEVGPSSTTTTLPYLGPELRLAATLEDGFWCTRVVDEDGVEYLDHSCYDARGGLGDPGEISVNRVGSSGGWKIVVFRRGERVEVVDGGTARVEANDPNGFVLWSQGPNLGTFWTEFDGVELECWVVDLQVNCVDR